MFSADFYVAPSPPIDLIDVPIGLRDEVPWITKSSYDDSRLKSTRFDLFALLMRPRKEVEGLDANPIYDYYTVLISLGCNICLFPKS